MGLVGNIDMHSKPRYSIGGRGAYEVLNYRILVDFFENYRDTVIKFLYNYRHRCNFYKKLYFPVAVG